MTTKVVVLVSVLAAILANPLTAFLQPSLFPRTAPTLRFSLEPIDPPSPLLAVKPYLLWRGKLDHKGVLGTFGHGLDLLDSVVRSAGFEPANRDQRELIRQGATNHDPVIPHWIGSWEPGLDFTNNRLLPYQKVNQTPRRHLLKNKAAMWAGIQAQIVQHGREEFDFIPDTFELPREREALLKAWLLGNGTAWLAKKASSMKSKHVNLIQNVADIPTKGRWVAQRYVSDPLLIDGRKTELRQLVLTTGGDPLRIYVYDDWIVRLGPANYSAQSTSKCHISSAWAHLNINKCGVATSSDSPTLGMDGKAWNRSQLLEHLEREKGVDTTKPMLRRVNDAIVKTVLATLRPPSPSLNLNRFNTFQLWGNDLLLDSSGQQPFVLEFNSYPSMGVGTGNWLQLKKEAILATCNTVGFQLPPTLSSEGIDALRAYLNHSQATVAFDPRFYPLLSQLSTKAKQRKYSQKGKAPPEMLDELTPDDVRLLMQTEDELIRAERSGGA
jgi:tubulin polyglutamylase TTLL4